MKKFILLLFSVFSGMNAQNEMFIFPGNQENDLKNQHLVFAIKGTNKELYQKTANFIKNKYKSSCVGFLNKNEFESLKIESNSILYKWQGFKTCASYQIEFEFKQDSIYVSLLHLYVGNTDLLEMCSYSYTHKPNGSVIRNKEKFTKTLLDGVNTLMSNINKGINKSSQNLIQIEDLLVHLKLSEKDTLDSFSKETLFVN